MAAGLGGIERIFGLRRQGVHGQAGFGHAHTCREGDARVARHVVGKCAGHACGQFLRAVPGANEEKIVPASKHGVGIGKIFGAQRGQVHGKKRVHLARQGCHLGKGGFLQPLLEDGAQVVHVALERHQRHLALPVGGAAGVVALGQAVFAGDVVKGFARAMRHRVGIHFFLDAFVFGLGLQVQAAKARHVGVDVAARVAVP